MTTDIFKEPKMKRLHSRKEYEPWSPSKKKRIKENFLNFCDIVLSYTQYEAVQCEEIRNKNNTSPLDSGGSTAESYTSDNAMNSPYTNTDDEQGSSPTGIQHNHHPKFGQHRAMKDSNKVNGMSRSDEILTGDDDSYDLVTCYCQKPYAGRPMIECSACLTWLHLTCAKIRRNNIPETFVCDRCKDTENNNKLQQKNMTAIHNSSKKKHRKSSNFGSSGNKLFSSGSGKRGGSMSPRGNSSPSSMMASPTLVSKPMTGNQGNSDTLSSPLTTTAMKNGISSLSIPSSSPSQDMIKPVHPHHYQYNKNFSTSSHHSHHNANTVASTT